MGFIIIRAQSWGSVRLPQQVLREQQEGYKSSTNIFTLDNSESHVDLSSMCFDVTSCNQQVLDVSTFERLPPFIHFATCRHKQIIRLPPPLPATSSHQPLVCVPPCILAHLPPACSLSSALDPQLTSSVFLRASPHTCSSLLALAKSGSPASDLRSTSGETPWPWTL
ncbi:hypothetical protein NQZ68_035228 [Dissostichus eleginoides]|nr:hypothetical protein NQZ68_035228 [Dissostichus eleginoides]